MQEYGYRCEDFFGEGYRDAASVLGHETFVLDNVNYPRSYPDGMAGVLCTYFMEKRLASAMGLKNAPEDWDKTTFNRAEDFDVDKDSAQLNISGCEYDWKIAEC